MFFQACENNSMTYVETERSDTSSNHRFTPKSKIANDGDQNQVYKPRTSSAVLTDQLRIQQSSSSNQCALHFKSNRASGRLRPPSDEMNSIRNSGKNFNHPQRVGEGGIYIISGKSTNSNPSTMERKNHIVSQNTASYSSATGMSSVSSANGIGSESSHTTNDVISECQSTYAGNEVANGDFHFVTTADSSPSKNLSSSGSFNLKSGSTAKLLPAGDDDSNTQVSVILFLHV